MACQAREPTTTDCLPRVLLSNVSVLVYLTPQNDPLTYDLVCPQVLYSPGLL